MFRRIILTFFLIVFFVGCMEVKDLDDEESVQVLDSEDTNDTEVLLDPLAEESSTDQAETIDQESNVDTIKSVEDIEEDISVTTESRVVVFEVVNIDEATAAFMTGKSYHENNQIFLDDLSLVKVGYIDYNDEPQQGSVIVNKVIAEDVKEIFEELYEARYPIERIEPVANYKGDDDASMVANNTSAFNYRVIAGTDRLSNHAWGLAIDINPLVNPWVTSSGNVYPVEGTVYADRSLEEKGMIKRGDACYNAFTSRGFNWGGDWNNSKDYQHFDITVIGIND